MEAELCLHGTKVASPCQRLTSTLAHTPECTPASFSCDGVKHAQRLHSRTPVLTPRLRGQECNCPAPLRLHAFTFGHRPPWPSSAARLHRQELSSAAKWYKRIIYLHLSCRCTVGGSWLPTPTACRRRQCLAAQNSAAHDSAVRTGCSWVSGLLVGVRWRAKIVPVVGSMHTYSCLLGGPRHQGADSCTLACLPTRGMWSGRPKDCTCLLPAGWMRASGSRWRSSQRT